MFGRFRESFLLLFFSHKWVRRRRRVKGSTSEKSSLVVAVIVVVVSSVLCGLLGVCRSEAARPSEAGLRLLRSLQEARAIMKYNPLKGAWKKKRGENKRQTFNQPDHFDGMGLRRKMLT